ncbi:MAG: hypothetical protein MR006_01935 [Arcanobacterium sp.]|nr:hypothetical protein [Arcanobacterium sp.]MDY5589435.1 hypothetical protein [Arcanobacterium sp.]
MLLKHEWRLNGQAVFGLLAAQIVCLVIGVGLGYLPPEWNVGVISTVQVLTMLVAVAAAVVLAVVLFAGYFRSMHGSLAAFTASTPVALGKHYAVKVLWAAVALWISFLLGFLGMTMIMGEVTGRTSYAAYHQMWKHMIPQICEFVGNNPKIAGLLILGTLTIAAGLAIEGAFVVTLGSSERMAKFGTYGGIVIMVVVAWAARNVAALLGLLIPVGIEIVPGPHQAITVSVVPMSISLLQQNILPLGILIFPALLLLAMVVLTVRSLGRCYSLR